MRFGPAFVSVLSSLSALTSVVAGRGRPLRQHVEPRALLDVCVNLDADILAKSGIIIPLDLLGALDICLCLSALPLALTTDIRLKLLALIPGNSELLAILTALINTSPGSKHCTYPPHSTPLCKADDPCGFHCDAPYVPKNGQCVCEAPYSICNDQCGSFPKGCGSAVPHSRRKHLTARSSGVFTYSDALATCKNEEQVCGVTHGATGFECLNTDQTLDSCTSMHSILLVYSQSNNSTRWRLRIP
ncbi:hypothetical protein BV25DRAFT_1814940 [Artomyces pyxidatus]|uniref:Uncharacterized protein n=1 Tax=Artomyces pyxidatus TaxID=48021 RepID=A0ACB8SIA9_9AGAM|nr:hypothetical protein BV25DRAFT_1814940 [Artomyces pyxidatus]